jgi:hypothetical protein
MDTVFGVRRDGMGFIMRQFPRKCKSFAFTNDVCQSIDLPIGPGLSASMIRAQWDVGRCS